jgi:hypothetical protein
MKAYWGSGGIAPRILDLGTRLRWVVSFTPQPLYSQGKIPCYPLDRRLGGPQSRCGCGGEEKNSQPPPVIELWNPDRPACSPALYRLSNLILTKKMKKMYIKKNCKHTHDTDKDWDFFTWQILASVRVAASRQSRNILQKLKCGHGSQLEARSQDGLSHSNIFSAISWRFKKHDADTCKNLAFFFRRFSRHCPER